jgi:hypothetical protein
MSNKRILPALAVPALLAALLAGCADDGYGTGSGTVGKSAAIETAPAAAPVAATPVLQYVSSGPVGKPILMQDSLFGGQVQVVVDSDYTSANGQHCRGFRTRTLDGPMIGKLYHACDAGSGWQLSGVERPAGL